ncbi:hypothetical protein HispidOSU_002384 [Sigmodon hispidus]
MQFNVSLHPDGMEEACRSTKRPQRTSMTRKHRCCRRITQVLNFTELVKPTRQYAQEEEALVPSWFLDHLHGSPSRNEQDARGKAQRRNDNGQVNRIYDECPGR